MEHTGPLELSLNAKPINRVPREEVGKAKGIKYIFNKMRNL
jgi:hypothetical protein